MLGILSVNLACALASGGESDRVAEWQGIVGMGRLGCDPSGQVARRQAGWQHSLM